MVTERTVTVLDEDQEQSLDGEVRDGDLLVTSDSLEESLGWHLEDRGLCRDDTCVPADPDDLLQGGLLDLEAIADLLDRPYAAETNPPAASLGTPARRSRDAGSDNRAPDFTLQDLDGNEHSLSDFEGNKIFLLVWASW